MMILSVTDLWKQFTGETLLKQINFAIDEKDKIGLVGANGAGKTTLIKILMGMETHDESFETKQRGKIGKKGNLRIGYLSQNFDLNLENTVFDELMSVYSHLKEDYKKIQILNERLAVDMENFDSIMEELAKLNTRYEQEDGYVVEYKVKQILNGLNFPEHLWKQKVDDLSGGQQSRVALGKILLDEPELLILDEPTNHLDLNAIEWLERYLNSYNKAFILISHDRYFLDNVINRVFEIENKTINLYKGNFTEYTIQKEAYLTGAVKRFEKEQDKIKKMEDYITKYMGGIKTKQALGRRKLLNRMEKMGDPIVKMRKMKLKFEIDRVTTDKVVKITNLSKAFGEKEIFRNINLDIYRGDKIGIMGPNGVGKSTILRIINDLEKQSSGKVELGEKLDIGYYDQNHTGLEGKQNILEELMYNYPLSEEEARTLAGGFLFSEDEIFKSIDDLSGGEKSRIALMKLILDKPNFLIMDEPTNHLDIYAREVLEESLEDYDGTLIVVSHDRHFLESVVNKIYEITPTGSNVFDGNYEEYMKKSTEPKREKEVNTDYEEQKRRKNRTSNLERKFVVVEKEIEKLEEKKAGIEELHNEAGIKNEIDKLMDLQIELDQMDEKIMIKMDEWEEINEELEELKEV
ncbi:MULTISPECIES: ABC-F family ATP-binding cassette domain-containing protein [Psychrilyobacter]|uniref:ATP-binding cassette domain-containing protein n=1 Tax=Psychrilyobacter piezotolerans TaxID=2293438 RepID=A0ABX9KDN6_9FUSO|nr:MULTISPECIES: ABC-F family ATP-binding cassette domain-containing protein [Psychrilyobacter]MCS5422861.1 ATP-binding cassette domain-containing protein [Psychrilyobacter sp. S5]NDI79090.1 ABC-F family ATP-binding cassette domain-containing protein [Psychrilyobacter piezotolerans]RDE59001.1 ABC transporter ATP-binding protein [Psychrilyobacter sp. S5]REI39573.1 ATP-binding cassette domain-containing protein [Psychrilyobacter piezotolerans]